MPRVKEAGFDHYLIKPVSVEALEKLLADLERAPWVGHV
jgi:YesN/AraC family two-component response regulator